MQTFNKRHFEEILKPCLLDRHKSVRVDGESHQMPMDEQYFSVNEAGVFPGIKYNAEWLTSETLLLRWRPARELDDPTIEVAETPMLPFDFTAKQLAAFMLAGPGSLVADFYGDWGDGPDSASLRHIDPDSKAHTAIVQAYAVYRETEKIVDPYPLELAAEAERARKAWSVANNEANQREGVFDYKPDTDESKARRKLAKASNAALYLKMEATAAEAKAAQGKWLEAMIRALLKPVQKSKLDVTTNVPVVVDEIDFKMMATRTQLINAFGNFTGMDMSWFNNLNDVPKLKAARKFSGKSGRHSVEPLFCPYAVMQWLADPRRKKGRKLSNEKAWSLLKGSFPSVYDQYSIGDPNND